MDDELEPLDSEIDEEVRNLTQQRMDERGVEERPVDAEWADADESAVQGGERPPSL